MIVDTRKLVAIIASKTKTISISKAIAHNIVWLIGFKSMK